VGLDAKAVVHGSMMPRPARPTRADTPLKSRFAPANIPITTCSRCLPLRI